MAKKLIVGVIIFILLLLSGCTSKELDISYEEREQLTNRILDLEKFLTEKDEEINRLKEVISNMEIESRELLDSLEKVRFSSYARLDDYDDSFDNLEKIFKINSKYEIKDNWYVISDDYFQIELLGYENAKKVDFYVLKLESDQEPFLIFTDTDFSDGWEYTNDNIGEIINKHRVPFGVEFSYEPYYLIYAEVTLKDGNVIRTSKLPIYNK